MSVAGCEWVDWAVMAAMAICAVALVAFELWVLGLGKLKGERKMSASELYGCFQSPRGVDSEKPHAYADISFLECGAGVRLRLAWVLLKAAFMACNPLAAGYKARALRQLRQEIQA